MLGAVSGPGIVNLALAGGSTNLAYYSSREGTNPPELVVETITQTPLTVDFSATPQSGTAPLSVSFTAQAPGATSFLWNFGDGGSSTERDPVHVYASPGSFTVSLEASNASQSEAT